MCGRFTLRTPAHELARQFELFDPPELAPRYNLAPSQAIAAIRRAADPALAPPRGRELVLLRWGLIPHWARDAEIGNHTINARSESAAEKPAFRGSFARRRCAVPADGFYEWRKVGNRKQPYAIARRDGRPFIMAGLWDEWQGPEGPVRSGTILTTTANAELHSLHERMPVILEDHQLEAWLDPGRTRREQLAEFLMPLADGVLTIFPVSSLVNSPRYDGPECWEPAEPEPEPPPAPPRGSRRPSQAQRPPNGQRELPF